LETGAILPAHAQESPLIVFVVLCVLLNEPTTSWKLKIAKSKGNNNFKY